MVCCCLDDSPIEDPAGRYRTFHRSNMFQTRVVDAPCADMPWSLCWCFGQFNPWTCGIAQYLLRHKALGGDMSKYRCCQGYYNNSCFQGCGEESCPELCLCIEAHCCNGFAVSATRMTVMDQYDLSSDPCDYQMIRFNNIIQILACVCDIAATFDENLRQFARVLDNFADFVYHVTSGCMTAQVAYELKYQYTRSDPYNKPVDVLNPLATASPYPYPPSTYSTTVAGKSDVQPGGVPVGPPQPDQVMIVYPNGATAAATVYATQPGGGQMMPQTQPPPISPGYIYYSGASSAAVASAPMYNQPPLPQYQQQQQQQGVVSVASAPPPPPQQLMYYAVQVQQPAPAPVPGLQPTPQQQQQQPQY